VAAANLALDSVELADTLDGFAGDRRRVRLLQVVELAPPVRPAGYFLDAALGIELVESRIGVGLQGSAKLPQMPLGMLALAIGRVGKPRRWRGPISRRAIIAYTLPSTGYKARKPLKGGFYEKLIVFGRSS